MREKFRPVPSVPVDDIKLDIFNFRYYGQLQSQRDCIEAMLNDRNSGLINIMKDIAQYGLTPDPIVISKDDNGGWIVREGNRRITALKLLNKPSIIEKHSLQPKIKEFQKEHGNTIPDTVDCITCDDEDTILEYLDRLHGGFYGGIGRRPWNPENKTYYDMHRGKPGENALAIKAKEMVKKEGVTLKEPYYITNLQRVLQNSGVQSKLKMSWDGENITTSIDKATFMNLLKEIVTRTGEKKAKEIYIAEQQQEFVDNIINETGIDLEAAKTEPYILEPKDPKHSAQAVKKKTGRTPSKPPWDRKRLIDPKRTRLTIPDTPENKKARDIYRELAREIDVRDATNAASVLLRVLLEFSIKKYQEKNALPAKDVLHKDIKSVAGHMKKEKKIDQHSHDEIIRFCNHEELLSAKSLQRLVHSPDFIPDLRTICSLWDNIEKFVSLCWK